MSALHFHFHFHLLHPNQQPILLPRRRFHPPQINPQFHLTHQHQHQIPHSSSSSSNPAPASELGDGLDLVAEFSSPHNHIRVVDVSPRAAAHPDHPLARSRLLLLDRPGNIHSILSLSPSSSPAASLPTSSYFDLFASLPPIVPPDAPLALLGFGAGSAARLLLALHPAARLHGYELDPCVLALSRRFLALADLEAQHPHRLSVHEGDALANATIDGGFAGVMVDLFLRGSVVPELQDAATWEAIKLKVRDGGRVMANLGGRCVEAEEEGRDGDAVMRATLRAMRDAFGAHQVFVLSLGRARNGNDDDSFVALTGPLPDPEEWKRKLPAALRCYVDLWRPCSDLCIAR